MTNCNCECFCEEVEYEGECLCCVCSQDDVPYVPSPSLQELERELAIARASIELYENKINMLDREDSDYEWKLNYYNGMLTKFRQNIFEILVMFQS